MHHGDQAVLGERLQQKSISAGVVRARSSRKNADDQDQDVTGRWVCFELTTQRQTIQLRNEDLAQDEIRLEDGNPGQRFIAIGRQLDPIAGLCKEVSCERPHVRVTFDDENGELGGRQQNTLDQLARLRNVRIRSSIEAARRFAWTAFYGVRTTVA